MGFYLHKSVAVGPFRFNLSGSGSGSGVGVGVGMSVGGLLLSGVRHKTPALVSFS